MGEIKTNDLQEVKKPAPENYQSIKPETSMSVQDARSTWDSLMENKTDDNIDKTLEKSNENRPSEKPKEDLNQQKGIGDNQEVKREPKNQGELGRTKEEIGLLKLLSSGELDGYVGNNLYTNGGSVVWTEIKDGIPVRYKKGPGGKYFDGKENIRYEGIKHTLEEWKTDDEKIAFLQKYGWLIDNDEVKDYSKKFKPEYQ